MARRRKSGIESSLPALAAMGFLAVMFIPGFKGMLVSLGYVLAGLVVLALLVGIGVLLIRRSAPVSYGAQSSPRITLETIAPTPIASRSVSPVVPPKSKPVAAIEVAQLRAIDWYQFEKLVAATYRKLGFTVQRKGGAHADGGIDLLIRKDSETRAVQCKHWKTWNVGVKSVREFLGALTDAKVAKGIFITLNGYTAEAKLLAEKHGIEMVNATGLVRMLEQTDARFDPEITALLNDQRKFCPKCESEMVLRTAKKGNRIGEQFWGCPSYPKCDGTFSLS